MRFISTRPRSSSPLPLSAPCSCPGLLRSNQTGFVTQLVALYPLTRVGMHGLVDFDYTRVTEPGPILRRSAPRHLCRRCQHQERHP